mgnify:CR=1 FL=1
MFPIRDDNPQFLKPYVTYGLIAANAVVWIAFQGLGGDPELALSVCKLGLVPGELLGTVSPGTALRLTPTTICVIAESPAYHTIFTSMFTHGSWMHLIGNMWFLWLFGDNVEDSMGHGRFLIFYILCGMAAAGLQVAFDPSSAIPMVGASGAIGGVMGAYVVLYPRVRIHMLVILGFFITTIVVPAFVMLGYWFILQLASGALSIGHGGGGVAFWAHVGGFAAGAGLIFLFKNAALVERHPFRGWKKL